MNTELAVSTKQLTKTFSGKEVIRDCTMSVEKGTIYGFLGKIRYFEANRQLD